MANDSTLKPFSGELDKPSAGGLKPFEGTLDGEKPSRSASDYARDAAAWTVKGAIAVPEAVVGLADIATGGRAGQLLENKGGTVGFRPKAARDVVNDWHSDATKEAPAQVPGGRGPGRQVPGRHRESFQYRRRGC